MTKDVVYQGIDLTKMQADIALLKTQMAQLQAEVATLNTQVAQLQTDVGTLKADVVHLQAEIDALKAQTPPPVIEPPPVVTPPPETGFKPVAPGPNDIYTAGPTVVITDTLSRNIVSEGPTPAQVEVTWPEAYRFTAQPDTADGGQVWEDTSATGQILTLYFCAPGLITVGASTPPVTPPPDGGTTPPPTQTGAPIIDGTPLTPAPTPVTADPNLAVLTRSDGRVVYHLGIFNPMPPADTDRLLSQHLGPYTVGSNAIAAHWWNARWTDRTNCPVAIKKSPAQIVSAHRMFPFANIGVPYNAPGARVRYMPMGSSTITIYQPTTGDRADIGLITDNSAYYMLGLDPGSMIDWALCGETEPCHFRDQSTDRTIDLGKYPSANAYDLPGYEGSPWLCKGPNNPADGNYPTFGGRWTVQQAHTPELSYVAFQATGDLGFLEDLQFKANFTVFTDSILSNQVGVATISGELRGLAWALRNLFMAHAATVDAEATGSLPSYLMPSSYFKQLLDNNLAWYGKALTDPTATVFHLIIGAGVFGPWQEDYLLTALGFGVLTGHTDWQPLYLFSLHNAIDRLSGTSGWPPAWGGYYLNGALASWDAAWKDLAANPQGGSSPTPEQYAALAADPFNGGVAMAGQTYLMTTRAVMAHAQFLDNQGICPVRATFPNLDACYNAAHKMIVNNGFVDARQSVVSDPALASGIIVPYTP